MNQFQFLTLHPEGLSLVYKCSVSADWEGERLVASPKVPVNPHQAWPESTHR